MQPPIRRLGDAIRAARAELFVGRTAELSLFREAVAAQTLPFHVLYLWGPGGVGKTALTLAFRDVCDEEGVGYHRLDGRDVAPEPEAFEQAVQRALGSDDAPRSLDEAGREGRFVLVLDSYEDLAALDRWICDDFLLRLPTNAMLVLAGRNERSSRWRSQLGLQNFVVSVALRNLSEAESRDYLGARHLPETQHADAVAFAHGYPLALSLIADAFDQDPSYAFASESSLDVVGTLLKRFLEAPLTSAQRRAVEASALARYVTQPLLEAIVGETAAPTLFDWLRDLSFVETSSLGLRLHDLAREVMVSDLRWRDGARYDALEAALRHHYTERLTRASGGAFEQVLIDYLFLVRDNPIVQPFYRQLLAKWRSIARPIAAENSPENLALLRDGVARHEGEASAQFFAAWVAHRPEGLRIFRDPEGSAIGLLYSVALEGDAALPERLADPGIIAAQTFLRKRAPLRANERGLLFRWWLSLEDYQDVSLVQGLVFVDTVRQYLRTPDLAYSLLPCAEPERWAPVFGYADLTRHELADFTVGERSFGTFGHDWRVRPPKVWLDVMAARGSAFRPAATEPEERDDLVVLSEDDFAEALKNALGDFTQPDPLRKNPLLRSRLVHDELLSAKTSAHDDDARIEALRALIRRDVETLGRGGREAKFARALEATYLDPAPTQERAAEHLGLPFSTYRRHLRSGLDALTDALWHREVGG